MADGLTEENKSLLSRYADAAKTLFTPHPELTDEDLEDSSKPLPNQQLASQGPINAISAFLKAQNAPYEDMEQEHKKYKEDILTRADNEKNPIIAKFLKDQAESPIFVPTITAGYMSRKQVEALPRIRDAWKDLKTPSEKINQMVEGGLIEKGRSLRTQLGDISGRLSREQTSLPTEKLTSKMDVDSAIQLAPGARELLLSPENPSIVEALNARLAEEAKKTGEPFERLKAKLRKLDIKSGTTKDDFGQLDYIQDPKTKLYTPRSIEVNKAFDADQNADTFLHELQHYLDTLKTGKRIYNTDDEYILGRIRNLRKSGDENIANKLEEAFYKSKEKLGQSGDYSPIGDILSGKKQIPSGVEKKIVKADLNDMMKILNEDPDLATRLAVKSGGHHTDMPYGFEFHNIDSILSGNVPSYKLTNQQIKELEKAHLKKLLGE